MAFLTINNVKFSGLSACVPKQVEENENLDLFASEEDARKFIKSTGVERRRIADSSTTTSDLCYHAAEKLIGELNWDKESIDCLIFVTQTPDYILPATSCLLQDRLGLSEECYTLDISLGCSGWVYGMNTLVNLIQSGSLKRGLLLCGDTPVKISSNKDKSAYPLFGDAGTVTALEYSEDAFDIKFHFASDGSGYDAIIIPDGGYRNPFSKDSLELEEFDKGINRCRLDTILNGMDVFSFGLTKAPETIKKIVEYANISLDEIDYVSFHQANKFMNENIRKKLKLKKEQVPYSLKNFGNTSSASIPITMMTELQDELINRKLKHIGCGFGVGLSWGSVYFETNKIVVPDLIEI